MEHVGLRGLLGVQAEGRNVNGLWCGPSKKPDQDGQVFRPREVLTLGTNFRGMSSPRGRRGQEGTGCE